MNRERRCGGKVPGGCLRSFCGGKGSTKVGEFLIRVWRDRMREGFGRCIKITLFG